MLFNVTSPLTEEVGQMALGATEAQVASIKDISWEEERGMRDGQNLSSYEDLRPASTEEHPQGWKKVPGCG